MSDGQGPTAFECREGAEPPRAPSRPASAGTLGLMAASFLFIAALQSASGLGTASAALTLLGVNYVVRWIRSARSAREATGAAAGRGVLVWPAFALLVALCMGAWTHVALDAKNASFVWDSLPTVTVSGTTYAWPGVYVPGFLAKDRQDALDSYLTGGPYVPQPSDTAAQGAARVDRYLRERFDMAPDVSELEAALAAHRSEATTSPTPGGASVHPYTSGMRAIEAQYADRCLRVLFVRSALDLLLLLVAGCAAIRLGAARTPVWIESRPAQVVVTVAALAPLAWTYFAHADGASWAGMHVFYRFHAGHFVATTIALWAVAVVLMTTAVRSAASTPPR